MLIFLPIILFFYSQTFYLLFFFSHLLFQNYAMSYKFDVQKILSLKLYHGFISLDTSSAAAKYVGSYDIIAVESKT